MKPSSTHMFYHVVIQSDITCLHQQITNAESPTHERDMLMCHMWVYILYWMQDLMVRKI